MAEIAELLSENVQYFGEIAMFQNSRASGMNIII